MTGVVVGVGVAGAASAAELADLVDAVLREAGVERLAVRNVATVESRRRHPAVTALGWPVVAFPVAALGHRAVTVSGRPVVTEPAALLAAGPGAVLVVPKRRSARATAAVARIAGG